MNENSNFAEYTVSQKAEGKYLRMRILLLSGYIAFAAVYFWFFVLGPIKIPMLVALLPLFIWIIHFFTWRYADVEHEYTIASGTMTLSNVYGNRSRRTLFETKVKDMSVIAPWNEEAKAKLPNGITKTIDMLSSQKSPDAYYAICNAEGGQKVLILFDAIEKSLKVMKFYNATATTVTKTRY
jgi:Invasion protein B, involved in pathogenesis